jgi:hypothetical protein
MRSNGLYVDLLKFIWSSLAFMQIWPTRRKIHLAYLHNLLYIDVNLYIYILFII